MFKSLTIAFCRIRWVHRIDSCSSVCLSLSNKSLVRSLGNSLSFRLARASCSFFCSLFRCATHYTSFLACPSAPHTLPRLPDSTSLSQTWFPWVDLFCTLPELTLYTGHYTFLSRSITNTILIGNPVSCTKRVWYCGHGES